METLIEFQHSLIEEIHPDFYRFLYHQLPWDNRMIAIRGLRGAGKTTLLLQHMKFVNIPGKVHHPFRMKVHQ